jgi:hypothetical protein
MKRSKLGVADLWPMAMALVFVVYGIYLLVLGPLETVVTPGNGSVTNYSPTSAGLYPLVAGGLVLYGLMVGRDRLVWAGGFLALLFSVAFLFSVGGAFIPVAVLLVAGLVLRRWLTRRHALRR